MIPILRIHDPRITLRAVIQSILCTAALFLLLPAFHLLEDPSMTRVFKDIKLATFPQRITAPPLETKQIEKKPVHEELLHPKLQEQRLIVKPRAIATDLLLKPGGNAGDFSVAIPIGLVVGEDAFVFDIDAVDTPPEPVFQVSPLYPLHLKNRGVEGEVVLAFTVTIDGAVNDITVTSAEPGDAFVKTSIRTVEKWKFQPGKHDGKAVPVRVILPLKYSLQEE